jgi:hypothetical protein
MFALRSGSLDRANAATATATATAAIEALLLLLLDSISEDISTPGSGQSTQVRRARRATGSPQGGYYSSGVEPRIRGVREKRLFLISLKDEERGQFT